MNANLPDAVLDADIAVLGRKGGGKTYTSKGIVERLLDMGRRVLVLDPLGVWAGLRTAADGERPGYPVAIFGGIHADLPLDTAAAPALAGIIARNNLPAVIDLSELSKSAQQSFLLAFLHELRRVNTEALTIVLEEADVFAPQQPMGDDSKALHGEIDWIARRGRFKGFRLITITQRPARLSKDVLTQCATLIAHRLPAPQDRDAIKAWVDGNGDRDQSREVFDTLAGLAVGEAWVWAPEHEILSRMRFPRIKTLDTSATPKAGEKRIEPKTLADVDLTAIRAALASAAADQEKRSPQRSGRAGSPAALPEDVKEAEARGFERGRAEVLATAKDGVLSLRQHAEAMLKMIDDQLAMMECGVVIVSADVAAGTYPAPAATPPAPARRVANGEGATLKGAAGPLLQAFARYPERGLTWAEACIVAGMLGGNGYFYAGRKALVEGGLVAEGNPPRITESGLTAAGGAGRHASRQELLNVWASKAKAPGPALLAIIAAPNYLGHWIDTTELARAAGMKPGNGYWYKGVKSLRDAGVIDQERGAFRLSAFMREAR